MTGEDSMAFIFFNRFLDLSEVLYNAYMYVLCIVKVHVKKCMVYLYWV